MGGEIVGDNPTYMLAQNQDAAIYEQIIPRKESQTERHFSNPIYGEEYYEVPIASPQPDTAEDRPPDVTGGCYEVPIQTRQTVPCPPSLGSARTRPPKSPNVYEERPQPATQPCTTAAPPCYEIPVPSQQKAHLL